MPKSRFDKYSQEPRDLLKELVLGRKAAVGMSAQELADKTGMCRSRYNSIMKGKSSAWKISDLIAFSEALNIPIEELRANVGR